MIKLLIEVPCPSLDELERWMKEDGWVFQIQVIHNGLEMQRNYAKWHKNGSTTTSRGISIPGRGQTTMSEGKIAFVISAIADFENVSPYLIWQRIMGKVDSK